MLVTEGAKEQLSEVRPARSSRQDTTKLLPDLHKRSLSKRLPSEAGGGGDLGDRRENDVSQQTSAAKLKMESLNQTAGFHNCALAAEEAQEAAHYRTQAGPAKVKACGVYLHAHQGARCRQEVLKEAAF